MTSEESGATRGEDGARHERRDARDDAPMRVLNTTLATERVRRRDRAAAAALRVGMRAASRAKVELERVAREQVAPRVDAALAWASTPEHVAKAQEFAAFAAQRGLSAGFRADPRAERLFLFSAWAEEELGRVVVAQSLVLYNPVLDGSLLWLMQTRLRARLDPSVTEHMDALKTVRVVFLRWMGYLVSMREHTPQPGSSDAAAHAAYIERADLPEEFKQLARMAMSDPAAFDAVQQAAEERAAREAEEAAARDETPKGLRGKLRAGLRDRLRRDNPRRDAGASARPRTGLTRAASGVDDPAMMFFIQSYLFFLQAYGSRTFIEQLPDLVHLARTAQELEEQADAPSPESPAPDTDEPVIIDL